MCSSLERKLVAACGEEQRSVVWNSGWAAVSSTLSSNTAQGAFHRGRDLELVCFQEWLLKYLCLNRNFCVKVSPEPPDFALWGPSLLKSPDSFSNRSQDVPGFTFNP